MRPPPPAEPAPLAEPVGPLDRVTVDRLRSLFHAADTNSLIHLFDSFVEDADSRIAALRAVAADGAAAEMGGRLHKLRGSCLMVGAARMAQTCRQLEQANQTKDHANLRRWIEQLDRDLEDVKNAIAAEAAAR